ncbi:cytochrome c [bacterium]|nr:cytochrome c [bacterium]
MKTFISLSLGLFSILLFQNCSGTGYETSAQELSSLSSNEDFSILMMNQSVTSGEVLIEVVASPHLLRDAKSVLWDHVLGEDLKFCDQSTSADRSRTTFRCPSKDLLTIYLIVTNHSNQQATSQVEIDLRSEDPFTPNPTDEIELTGQQIYEMRCAGCHKALSQSEKRGVTLNRLNTALNTVSAMGFLKNQLSEKDKSALIEALNN